MSCGVTVPVRDCADQCTDECPGILVDQSTIVSTLARSKKRMYLNLQTCSAVTPSYSTPEERCVHVSSHCSWLVQFSHTRRHDSEHNRTPPSNSALPIN